VFTVSLAAAARDILVNFEISLAVFIPNTPRNRAISYTNTISGESSLRMWTLFVLLCGNCDSMDFEEFGSWGEKKFSCCRDSEHSHLQTMAFEALYKDSKYPSHGVIE